MSRDPYPTDLTDTEWAALQSLLLPARREHPASSDLRKLVNAVLYVRNGGCGGALLPHKFPPWWQVQAAVRQWQQDGTWDRLERALEQVGLIPRGAPSAALLGRRA